MPGANPDNTAFYSDVVGPLAEVPNIHPVTVFPSTATYTVASGGALTTALSSAVAGDTIECLTGSYGDISLNKVNAGADIRIFCRTWHSAVFGTITVLQDFDGVQIENIRATRIQTNGTQGCRSFQAVGCWFDSIYAQYFSEDVRFQHCLVDLKFKQNSQAVTLNYFGADCYFENCIIAHGGADNMQVKGIGPTHKFIMRDCAGIGPRSWPNLSAVDPHSDVIQFSTAPANAIYPSGVQDGQYEFTRCFFWSNWVRVSAAEQVAAIGAEASNPAATEPEETNDGMLLGDGSYVGDMTNVYVCSDGFNTLATRFTTGTVGDSIAIGKIWSSGDGVNHAVRDSISESLTFDGTSPTYSGNLTGPAETWLVGGARRNGDTVYKDWRDFRTTNPAIRTGGQDYLDSLAVIWGGAAPDPAVGARTRSNAVSMSVTVG
jgi:hypothetical protein